MVQLWALAQAQEAARLAVEQLVESAKRSRIHKSHCHNVALAGRELYARLEAAVRERTGDDYILCSVAARLSSAANSCRACVEQHGNPTRLGRITTLFIQPMRRNAERALVEQYTALLRLAEEFASLWTTSTPLRVATSASGALSGLPSHSPMQHQFSSPAFLGTSRHGGVGGGGAAAVAAPPPGTLTNAVSSPLAGAPWTGIETALMLTPRVGGGRSGPGAMLGLSPAHSGLRLLGGGGGAAGAGPGSESMLTLSPSAISEEADALRSLPFEKRPVRPSDGNPVQRLCFMRGAGGEGAAVQLMVVLNRQVEVYSAALDSFHSDTPLESEPQQVTSTALYEPTIDLITGHRGGTVLVYGRVGAVLSASASSLRGGVLSAAAAAATAAQQAGVPLVIRLSRGAVTALHCVPAIELEAATAAATAAAAAAAAAADSGSAPQAQANDEPSSSSRGAEGAATAAAALPAPSPEAIASGAIGCCTADDVLLFTGDSLGRVMAVRYSRVQPEVLATTVFTTSRRASRNANAPPSETQSSTEITGLLYRAGCLLVSTATDMYSIRVVAAPPQPSTANGNATSGGGNGNGEGAATEGGNGNNGDATRSPGGGANGALTAANNGGRGPQGSSLPPSSSVNLLSPAASAMPMSTRGGGANAVQPAPVSGGGAGGNGGGGANATSGGGGAGASGTGGGAPSSPAGGPNGEPIIRRGPLSLSSTLADSFHFTDFDSCTALVAIDWPVPGGASGGGANAGQQPSLPRGDGGAAAPTTPRVGGAGGILGLRGSGGLLGMSDTNAFWSPTGTPSRMELLPPPSVAGRAASAGGAGTSGGRSPKFVSPKTGPWRMLSAHMNGQLLMWDVTAGRLQLICAIGQPGPPIINVFTFPELGTMVELLSSGFVRVGPLPTSALAPPINPLGQVPVWQFGRAMMRVHRGRLTAGAALANCVATGSRAGGVKVHSAAELRAQAARQNVAFLAPWPGAAGAGAAAASGGAGGRQTAAASPTASLPPMVYPPLEHNYNPSRGGGTGVGEPPYHRLNHLSGPPGGMGGASGHGSLASTAAAAVPQYPSAGGAYPGLSRMPSGHTLNSIAGVPPSAYPFMPPQMSVPGADAFGGAYPLLHTGSGAGVGGPPPHQRVPGPSGGGVGEAHAAAAAAAPPPAPAARGLTAPQPISAFAMAGEGPDAPSLPRNTGGGGGPGVTHHALPNGIGHAHGLANGLGHGHGPRSEDSMGNLSAASSVANNGAAGSAANGVHKPAPPGPPPRSMTGLRTTSMAHGIARVSDRPGGDTTPTRPAKVMLSATERAVAGVFGVPGAAEDASTKLPTVLPAGYDSDDAAADAAAAAAAAAAGPGETKPGGEPASQSPLGHPTPHYRAPPPHHNHLNHHSQQAMYSAPPSPLPTSSGAAASALPNAVVHAATVEYGTSSPYGGHNHLNGHGLSPQPAATHYPAMPTVGTAALSPPPPPHAPLAAHSGGLVLMSQAMSPRPSPPPPQALPWTVGGVMDSHPNGFSNCPPSPPLPMAYPGSVGMGLMPRGSDYGGGHAGTVPLPMYGGGVGMGVGVEQHVPGPQLGMVGRRMSGRSDYDPMSGAVTPLPADELGGFAGDDLNLPPPPPMPVVRPPPPCDPTVTPTPKEPQLSQNCFIRPEELRNIEQIGEGAEGIVYRGRWHHIDVAVKEMHPSTASFDRLESMAQDLSLNDPAAINKDLANLIKEVAALIDLGQHPNIIRFIGVCASPPRIVTEYYKMGSLFSMLKEARQGNIRTRERLAWDKRLIMLKDIAAGMAFLHSRDYIHGDLRSPNVFVTEDGHLKIGDFGFARILGKAQNAVVPARLTNPRWQAPEVYDMTDPIATTAADVYSFGIIMYEMLTFRLPYDDEPHDEVVKLRHTMIPSWRPHIPPDKQLPVQKSVTREGHLPPLQAYKTLMMDCWAEDPADRPGFHKIATRLNALCHWQWALNLIQRGLRIRQRQRPAEAVTPTCATPTSVSSPTHASTSHASAASAGAAVSSRAVAPAGPQVLNRFLDEVATTLEQQQLKQGQGQQQGPGGLLERQGGMERHTMEVLRHDEPPLTAVSSPAGPPPSAAAPAAPPVLPLLPQLPPLAAAAPPPPQQQKAPAAPPPARADALHRSVAAAAVATAAPPLAGDSPTRSRPTTGFGSQPEAAPAAKRSGGGAASASAANGGPDVARRLAASMAAPPLAVPEPPDLETAPTLASSGSRPLHVSAAGGPPRFPPGSLLTSAPGAAAVAGAAAAAAAPSSPPSSPPPFPAVRGGDSHALLSPFQSMRLSDDEDEDPRAAAAAAAVAAAAAAQAGGSSAAAPAAAGYPSRPQATGLPPKPPSASAAATQYASPGGAPPPPPPLGTASSVVATARAAALVPPRMGSPAGPPKPAQGGLESVASVAPPAPLPVLTRMATAPTAPVSVAPPAVLTRGASFQPTLPKDPLEMRTAFHMGMGFSIDDDEDDE